jgi:UDP-2,4-diacetamido-2,4,6-trideoxy-beta-L-altropyranose hydrolase
MCDRAGVSLRRATAADSRRLWELRNEETVRRVSFGTEPIPFESHERWFGARRADGGTIFLVSAPGAADAGYVRFDTVDGEAQVSVALAPGARGRGLGPAALRAALVAFRAAGRPEPVVALVRTDNARSLHAFRRAGFVPRGERRLGDLTATVMAWPDTQRVLLAADGGADIGLGHLGRTLALAGALEADGAWAGLVTPRSGPFRTRVESAHGCAVTIEDWPAWDASGIDRLVAAARETDAATLVVDSYRADDVALERLRAAGLTVVAFDDVGVAPSSCHLVVDPSPGARGPRRSRHGDTLFLLGPSYATLRPEFWTRPGRTRRDHVAVILLTLGGGEVPGLAAPLLAALDAAPGDFVVDAVVGPFADPAPWVDIAARCRRIVRVHHDPPDLRGRMLEADLAVSAAGQTLFELAWAGCPAVAIAVADNQRANLAGFAARGTVRAVPEPDAPEFAPRLGEALAALIRDGAARRTMAEAGQRLVDGQGARRIAAAVLRGEVAA